MQCCFFGFQHLAFAFNHFSVTLAVKTAEASVCGYDTVAWNLWRKWIVAESLTYGLCAAASYAASQFAIGYCLAYRYVEQFQIDAFAERSNVLGSEDEVSDFVHVGWRVVSG